MKHRHAALLCSSLLVAAPVQAEEWTHELSPYVWGAQMDGTTGVRGVNADVSASFGDIVDNLEMGFMGSYRASRDRLSVAVDAIYMGLGATGRGPRGFTSADVDLDQTALEVDLGYEVLDRLTVFAGLRYIDLSVDVDTTGPLVGTRSASGSESWIDPVVGALYALPLSDAWSVSFRGDIGGFGIGSDFAWQGIASLRWQASPTFGVVAAYRYISMDYDDGNSSDAFRYDMTMSGPALGVVFTF